MEQVGVTLAILQVRSNEVACLIFMLLALFCIYTWLETDLGKLR